MSNEDLHVNMQRDFKGIWIPREIWLAEGLAPTEKILWAEIHSLHNREKGGCYASNDYLCQFMGVKERRLQEMISNLKDYGLVELVSFNGRERILKAIVPPDGFQVRRAEVQKSAPQGCIIMHPSDAVKCTPPIYIDNKDYSKEYIPSTTLPKNPTSSEPADAGGVKQDNLSSQKIKKAKPLPEFSPKVKSLGDKMIAIIKKAHPVYRFPDKLDKFYLAIQDMLEKDKQSEADILKTFEWACNDSEQRGEFKGWQAIICTNKRKGKPSSPAEIFRHHFSTIWSQMKSRPQRKFAPCSNDEESLEKILEWDKGAL